MIRRVVAYTLVLGLARDPCGGVDSPTSGVNGPCTRQGDCRGGLVCVNGVCAEADAAPPPDAGEGGDAGGGSG